MHFISLKKLKIICVIFFSFSAIISYSQSFDTLKFSFLEAYYGKEYEKCFVFEKQMREKYPKKISHIEEYHISLAYVKAQKIQETFNVLQKAVRKGFVRDDIIMEQHLFDTLRKYKIWEDIISGIKANILKERKKIKDTSLADELLRHLKADQEYRKYAEDSLVAENGVYKLPKHIARKAVINDSLNLIWIKDIVFTKGWPGKSMVGEKAAEAAFYLAQHADKEPKTQERFLEKLRINVKKGENAEWNLAYLTDRVLRAFKKSQQFGTQAWLNPETKKFEIAPMDGSEAEVNYRRLKIWLSPLSVYKRQLGIKE